MGRVFEEICKQYIVEEAKLNRLSFFPGKIGKWWGNNPKKRRQEEIDIMVYHKDSVIYCECKWTNSLVNIDVLNDLIEQSKLFTFSKVYYWIFSRTGFTNILKTEAAKHNNLRLITFSEMI